VILRTRRGERIALVNDQDRATTAARRLRHLLERIGRRLAQDRKLGERTGFDHPGDLDLGLVLMLRLSSAMRRSTCA
jgi:hypothetical protein